MKTVRTNPSKSEPRVTRGTGNVFSDLGFSTRESAELQVKAELVRQICNRIKSVGFTQVQAARRLGVSQPDVSKLMNSRYSGFSVDRLISFLISLKMDVEIIVRPNKHARQRAGVARVKSAKAA